VHSLAALALLAQGCLRVLYCTAPNPASSCYQDPLFWWKVGLCLAVGALSLYPTVVTYIAMGHPTLQGRIAHSEPVSCGPAWMDDQLIELASFALICFLATLMGGGMGLPQV